VAGQAVAYVDDPPTRSLAEAVLIAIDERLIELEDDQ
jgi:hypothetical protein